MRVRGAIGGGAAILLLWVLLPISTSAPRASEDPFDPATRAALLNEHQWRLESLRQRLRVATAGLEDTLHSLRDFRIREHWERSRLEERTAELQRLEQALARSAAVDSSRREAFAAAVLRGVRWHRGNASDRALGLAQIRTIALSRKRDGITAAGRALRTSLEEAIDRAADDLEWLDARAAILHQALARQRREIRELGLVLDEAERRRAVLSAAIARTPTAEAPRGMAARSLAGGLPHPTAGEGDGRREGSGPGGITRLPVRGEVLRRFGDRHGGQRSRGILLSGHPQPVLAPGRGTVAYAGPFRGFGLLLIIEHGADYHSLVMGASRLEVTVGDPVRDGQVVGWLEGNASEEAELYLELRRAGEPIDPMLVLSARESEVRG